MKFSRTYEGKLLVENRDYELIPQEGTEGWDVRLLDKYVETVIRFGNITMDGREGDPIIKYNFKLVSTPDPLLDKANEKFQEYIGDILFAIMRAGIEEGTLQTREVDQKQ